MEDSQLHDQNAEARYFHLYVLVREVYLPDEYPHEKYHVEAYSSYKLTM